MLATVLGAGEWASGWVERQRAAQIANDATYAESLSEAAATAAAAAAAAAAAPQPPARVPVRSRFGPPVPIADVHASLGVEAIPCRPGNCAPRSCTASSLAT